MINSKRLDIHDRLKIEGGLLNRKPIKQIAERLGKSPSTISREIRAHMCIVTKGAKYSRSFNDCIHRFECIKEKRNKKNESHTWGDCIKHCNKYEKELCPKREKPPYVCNGCTKRVTCQLEKRYYYADKAQNQYQEVLKESRIGISIDEEELQYLNELICPLLKKGQSFHHIYETHKNEIPLSERALYNYIKRELFNVTNLELPRLVRYKKRVNSNRYKFKVDKKCFINRDYENYYQFIKENSNPLVVELDSVEGKKGYSVLLTVHFVDCSLMLAFKRERNTARSVIDIFNELQDELGIFDFKKLFPVILTDRGKEFTNPTEIELSPDGQIRTNIFYCDPMCSWQKGECEVNHELIRRIVPKGKTFDAFSQPQINLMMNHINSYTRKKLGNRTPYEVFKEIYGLEIIKKLGINFIQADEVTLKPSLLK